MIINIENENNIAPMYVQYDGQINPQPAYIEIDPRGDNIIVNAETSSNIGPGCSQATFHGVVTQIRCPEFVRGDLLKDYLESLEFEEKVIELCENYDCEWDGSNNIGKWNENRFKIEEEIYIDLLSLESVEIYDGREWIEDSITYYNEEKVDYSYEATLAVYDEQGINLKITEKNIDTIVKDAEKYIDPNYQLVEGLEEYLLDIIEEMEYNKE
jgi:hypothetical protein